MLIVREIDHVVLRVSDMEAMIRFYCEVLGTRLAWRRPDLGLVHLRAMLGNINVLVIPDQISVPRAHEAFNSDGSLKDAKQQSGVEGLGRKLTELLQKLHSA